MDESVQGIGVSYICTSVSCFFKGIGVLMIAFISFIFNILMSFVFLLYLKNNNRDNFIKIKRLRTFLNFKPIIYFLCIFTFASFLANFKIKLLVLLIPLYIMVLILTDASIFYKISKKIRNADISFSEYIKYTFADIIIILLPLILVVALNIFFPNSKNSTITIVIGVIILYNLGLPYILKIRYKDCKPFNTEGVIEVESNKFKILVYDGTQGKEANATVCGMLPPYHIFVSDYLIDNLTKNELKSVLLHELGHIYKHHFIIKNLYLALVYPIMSFIGWILDTYFSTVNFFFGLFIMISSLILFGGVLFLVISRKQEYSADRYAVTILKDKEVYISALEKIRYLNMSADKVNKGDELLSTHPSFSNRIDKIKSIPL